jgi:hypothetical protein
MPEKETLERAREDEREGKSPSTQAGEFVREEMEHIREGKHGASSAKQAIAIGLSKARRAGVKLPPPKKGTTSKKVRRQARCDLKRSKTSKKPSKARSRRQATSQERTAFCRVASRLVPPSPRRRSQTHQGRSLSRREESRCHPQEKETLNHHGQLQTIRRRPPQH